jgi:hypothetical protein
MGCPSNLTVSLSLQKQKWKKNDWMISGYMDGWMDGYFLSFFTIFHITALIQNVQHGGPFYHFPHHPF